MRKGRKIPHCECGKVLNRFRDRCDDCAAIESRHYYDYSREASRHPNAKYMECFTVSGNSRLAAYLAI